MIAPATHNHFDLPELFHILIRFTRRRTIGIWNGTRLGRCRSTNSYDWFGPGIQPKIVARQICGMVLLLGVVWCR